MSSLAQPTPEQMEAVLTCRHDPQALSAAVLALFPGRSEAEIKAEGIREMKDSFAPTEGPSELEGPPLTAEGEETVSTFMSGWKESQLTMLHVMERYAHDVENRTNK